MTHIERATESIFDVSFAGTATSAEANLRGRYPIAIHNVESGGPTSCNIEIKDYLGNWVELYDSSGTIIAITLVAQKISELPDSLVKALAGRTFRLKNGSSITKTLKLYASS